jgi:sirohydrochlorin ferrochelatase
VTAVVIFAHGSRVEAANEAVRRFAREVGNRSEWDAVEPAFLELGTPSLQEAVSGLVARGVNRVVVVPYFLTPGIHLERDLPRIAGELCSLYPGVRIDITDSLDRHPALEDIVLDRVREVLGQ